MCKSFLVAALLLIGFVDFQPDRLNDLTYFAKWATRLSGYPMPAKMPTAYLLTDAQITAMYCSAKRIPTDSCDVAGFYGSGQVLWINRDMPMRDIEDTIIHEFTHFLQVENHDFQSRCSAEIRARQVEWAYGAVVHGDYREFTFNREWYNC